MVTITKEQLTGFRNPTDKEKEEIQGYMENTLAKTRRTYRKWNISLGSMAGILSFYSLMRITEKTISVREIVLFVAVILILLLVLKNSMNHDNKIKLLALKIGQGDFVVLDCFAKEFDPKVNSVTEGLVSIYTKDGKLCRDRFLVDSITAKEYQHVKDVPLLLMFQKECNHYEMFTERKRMRR